MKTKRTMDGNTTDGTMNEKIAVNVDREVA
jgi:hypothetical protein